jgi:hypothetical protein
MNGFPPLPPFLWFAALAPMPVKTDVSERIAEDE